MRTRTSRRTWLVLLSVVSLVTLLYASVFTAFSVPVTEEMERANRRADASEPRAGMRALLVPIADPTLLATRADPRDGDANGTLLVAGTGPGGFPSGTSNATMGRALVFVAPTANGTYSPESILVENATWDVAALARGRAGFLVKGDAEATVRFVARDEVVGAVARYAEPGTLFVLFTAGGLGFLAPLVGIILTHRATGRAGVPGSALSCPECRAPRGETAEFCLKCGAWFAK